MKKQIKEPIMAYKVRGIRLSDETWKRFEKFKRRGTSWETKLKDILDMIDNIKQL